MSKATGIAAIGECMLELSSRETGNWHMGFAGDTLNTLWAMRALLPDARCDYVTAFGDDPFSGQQIDFLGQHKIGTAASPVIQGARPGLYAITLDGAERSFTYWRSDSAAKRLADDRNALAKSLSNLKLAYFSGITLAILEEPGRANLLATIREARKAGTLIAFDPNYRPKLWTSKETAREAMEAALSVADIALPTFPDEHDLYGDASPGDTLDRLKRADVTEAVVKNGTEDALILSGGEISVSPASRTANAVDTTGAGDAFNGGYLAARLLGHAPEQAAIRAHRTAAAVVGVRGALAPFETLRSAFAG